MNTLSRPHPLRTWPALLLATFACHAAQAATGEAPADAVRRGEYLARIGGCEACHTAKNGEPFAGGLLLETPFGPLATPNITPDKDTGIGTWTDDDFYRTMHEGIGKKGEYLYPAMPFPWYTNVSRDDVLAIKAYLFSRPAVKRKATESHLMFPFSWRTALLGWRTLFFKPADADAHTKMGRGDYLVNGLGHCGECHNGRLLAGASKTFQKPLQGGKIDDWYAPNITADFRDGIGKWSPSELVQYLQKGMAPGRGIAVGPMSETVHSVSRASGEDLQAVASYLLAAPAVANGHGAADGNAGSQAAGAQLYVSECSSCHGLDGKGQPGVVPALAGNGGVTAKGPENVIQVVLGGLQAKSTYAPMLAIGAGLSDADVADIANYVRRSWGNDAPANASANAVHELRGKTDTPMNPANAQSCPAVQPALANALGARQSEIAKQIRATTDANMPQQVLTIVTKTRQATPKVAKADLVNGLTAAYCQALTADSNADQKADRNGRALLLGHFSTLVYMQLSSNGLAPKAR